MRMKITVPRFLAQLASAVVLAGTSAGAVMAAGPAEGPAAQPASPGAEQLVYGGKLQDASGRPIAGIYPLTFAFYKTEKAGRAVWSEAQFVAVDNGVYAVALGMKQPLPKGFAPEKMFLGVAVTGGKEIVRERFAPANVEVGSVVPSVPAGPAAPVNVPGAPPSKVAQSYADLAGRALEAQSAEKLGTLSEEDVRKLVKASGDASGGKVKIGAAKRYTENAGGAGGTAFTLMCPPGHVAVGIRGAGAAYIDSISVICSPLE